MALMSANCIICERAIQEKDDVLSAFRMVDLFYARSHPGLPLEQQAIPVTIVGIVRITADDVAPHSASIVIRGPDREPKYIPLTDNQVVPTAKKFHGLPKMLAFLGQMGVTPHLGLYEVSITFDGQEVAKNQFIIVEQPAEQSPTIQDTSVAVQPRPQ